MAKSTIAQIKSLFKEQDHRLHSMELLTQLTLITNHHIRDKLLELVNEQDDLQ